MTTKINLSNIDSEQDYSSLATTLFAKANVAANIANTALATASTILKVTSIVYPGDDTAADTAGGQTITLTGTGFVSGASVLINGSAVGVVSVANSTTLTFTSPSANSGSYVIYIVNPDGGTAISIPGIQYSGTPTWTTAAGSLGSLYETAAFSNTVVATGDTVTYSLQSGTLPPGATFSSNGTITGTSSTLSSPTTYTFTVRATDAQNQDTDRSFSITINPDAVTWSSPTTNASYTITPNVAMSNVTLVATSAAGANIFYSANTLPTGVSLTGNTIFGTPTVSNETTTSLVTATANTTSESSSIVLNWTVSVAGEPFFKYNSLLLSGDGTNNAQNNTFLDGSTNNFTITRNGNTTQGTFSPYGPNWSNYFGSANYISAPSNAAFGFGTGDFTVEAWVFPNEAYTTYNYIWATGITNGLVFYVLGGVLYVRQYGASDLLASSTAPALNTWTHVAATRSGTTLRIFVNGVQTGTTTNSTNFATGSGFIGNDGTNAAPWLGYISNMRVVKGTAVYTSNFTPSTTPLTAISGTSILTCQSNRFIDNSSNSFALTVSGTPTIQRFSPFSPTQAYSTSTIGGSGYFVFNSDYLTTPSASAFNLASNNFTIEGWVYLLGAQGLVGQGSVVLGKWTIGGGGAGPDWFFGILNPNQLYFSCMTTGGSELSVAASSTIPYNTWTHLAAVRNSNTITIYQNGSSVGTLAISSAIRITGTTPVRTCVWDSAGSNYYGYLSDVRLVNGTAIYTTAFTPPTAPLTAITNTSLLLSMTNAGIIDNTMINNLQTVGNAKISTTQSKFGGSSMSFDGSGDYLSIPSSPQYSFGTGDFTIEGWAYPTSGTNNGLFQISDTSGGFKTSAGNSLAIHILGTNSATLYANGSIYNCPNNTLPFNTWTHLAIVRSSGVTKLYINGSLVTTIGTSGSITDTTNYSGTHIVIGGYYSTSYLWNGYVDDFRITKGVARYTANFTPPTALIKQ